MADCSEKLISENEFEGVKFSLFGSRDFPLIEVVLEPGKSVCAEPGRMIQLPEGIDFTTIMGNGDEAGIFGKLKAGASRMMSGDDCMLARFTNPTQTSSTMRFGTVIMGHLIPINLADYGGEIIGMSGVYLLGSQTLKVQMCFRQSLGAMFFGGESFILQKISGTGTAILQAGGTVLKEELTPERPTIKVDTGCLVAFTSQLAYTVEAAGTLKSWVFGGEGIFFANISLKPGETEGIVWVETFPYMKFIGKIKQNYYH